MTVTEKRIERSNLLSRQRQWQLKHPEKRQAHDAVRAALRRGLLVKPDACQDCGSTARLDGHHPDHAKPLLVEWLCRRCHCRRHLRKIVKGPKS